jgi:mandelate racemase
VTPPKLTVRNIRAVGVKVPMTYVLGTSQEALREAPLLLVDLETEEGVTGHAYQFCYVPAAAAAIVVMLDEVLRTGVRRGSLGRGCTGGRNAARILSRRNAQGRACL